MLNITDTGAPPLRVFHDNVDGTSRAGKGGEKSRWRMNVLGYRRLVRAFACLVQVRHDTYGRSS